MSHFTGATGVIGAFDMLTDEIIQLFVALNGAARLDFMFAIGRKGLLPKNLAGQADTVAKICPILFVRHIVKLDLWGRRWIRRSERHRTA